MTYAEKLKDPRWQKKRLEIMQRDDFTCRNCQSKENTLHIHHLVYLKIYVNPWDYPNNLLATLCEKCHGQEEEYKNHVKDLLFEVLSILTSKTAGELFYSLDPSYYLANNIVETESEAFKLCISELLNLNK